MLEDDKLYSTIHEAQIYRDEDSADDEERKGSSDDQSMQSEEARHPDDYQSSTHAERKARAALHREANREAAEEARLDEIGHELKEKLNLQEFDVTVSKTAGQSSPPTRGL